MAIRITLTERQQSAFECSYVSAGLDHIEADAHADRALIRAYADGFSDGVLLFERGDAELIKDALLELINLNSDIAEGRIGTSIHDKDERANARGDSRSFDAVWNKVAKAVR